MDRSWTGPGSAPRELVERAATLLRPDEQVFEATLGVHVSFERTAGQALTASFPPPPLPRRQVPPLQPQRTHRE